MNTKSKVWAERMGENTPMVAQGPPTSLRSVLLRSILPFVFTNSRDS